MATLKPSPIEAFDDQLEIHVAAVGLLDSIDSLDLDVLHIAELLELVRSTETLLKVVRRRAVDIHNLITERLGSYR